MKKFAICIGTVLLLLLTGVAFAADVTVVSRKLEDKGFSREYTVTLDSKSVKDKGEYFTAAVTTTVDQKETFKPGESREEKRTSKYVYAFNKKERKYKVLGESESISYSGNCNSQQQQQSTSHSSKAAFEWGIGGWKELPKEADDILNKLYDKTLEIGKK